MRAMVGSLLASLMMVVVVVGNEKLTVTNGGGIKSCSDTFSCSIFWTLLWVDCLSI